MRKLGLQTITLVNLIRYFGFFPGLGIFFDLIFSSKKQIVIQSKVFHNPIYLRKDQSDPYIFEQVFVEQQYRYEYGAENTIQWIIDAGANIGLAAIYFSQKFPNAKIISIEPDRNNYELLQKNTKNYPNVHPIHAALWYRNEKLDISNKEELSAGFMIQSADNQSSDLISAVTLPELIEKYQMDEISILKLDIEGSEKELFQHHSDVWIPKCNVIITELHDWMKAGTSKVFFTEMAKYNWNTYVKGENIICIKA